MTAEQIWAALVAKRPALQNPDATVTFTSERLRRLVYQVHGKGQGEQRGEDLFEKLFRRVRG